MTPATNKLSRIPGAVLYTRVSTGEQDKNGTSPETQRDACRAKALALSLPIVAEYYDGGISGGYLLTRPGMQAALTDILTGRADTLICANMSRYSRDVEHQQAIKKAVKAAGGRIVFCDMDFDDTPEGDLAFGIMGGFAQYEKAVIKDRTMKGKRKRAEEGQQPQRSTPAYGYHIVTNAQVECGLYPPEMRGRYLIVEETAVIVRDLFARYAAGGVGFPPLARDLNARQIPASRGGVWHPVCVSVILRNPVYKGEPAYGRVSHSLGEAGPDDRHLLTGAPLLRPRGILKPGNAVLLTAPPIVSEELWDKVQARLAANQKQQSGNPRRARMLSGRVYCPCGHNAALVGQPGAKYYQCAKAHLDKSLYGRSDCLFTSYELKVIEQSVIVSLLDAAARPEAITAAVQVYQEQQDSLSEPDALKLRSEKAALKNALAQIAQDEAAAVQAQIAGIQAGASPNAYAAVFADIAARRKDLETRQQAGDRLLTNPTQKKAKNDHAAPQLARQALTDTARVLSSDAVPGHSKRDLVAGLIDHVVCQREGAEVYFLPGLGKAQFCGSSGTADTCNSTLTELIQYRWPVGFGPSGKTWPRWLPQRAQVTSIRRIPNARSSCISTVPGLAS